MYLTSVKWNVANTKEEGRGGGDLCCTGLVEFMLVFLIPR
jgi:hypothetical protein